MPADVSDTNRSHWTPPDQLQHPASRCFRLHLCHDSPPTVNTDRTPEPPMPSSTIASTSAATAPAPTATAFNPDTPTDTNLTTASTSDVGSVHTVLIAIISHIGLVGRLRIRRTDTEKTLPGVPTYTHRTRLNRSHCPRTFRHRMGPFGHMRIHESGIYRGPDIPITSTTIHHAQPHPRFIALCAQHHHYQHRKHRTVPAHSPLSSAWSVTCESITERLANQCQEHPPHAHSRNPAVDNCQLHLTVISSPCRIAQHHNPPQLPPPAQVGSGQLGSFSMRLHV
nr:unnamed protein product [Spirometra erinaceieuropaei]